MSHLSSRSLYILSFLLNRENREKIDTIPNKCFLFPVFPIDEYKEKFIAYLEDFNKTYELPKYKNDSEYSPTTSKTIESFIKIIKDDKSIKKSCNDKLDNTKEYFTNAPDIV